MSSIHEVRQRIRSVKNIAQVTRALETVSASKVHRATQAYLSTLPYIERSWKVLVHLARQPGSVGVHPLLHLRDNVKNVLVLLISSDRGLAGAYNVNIIRKTLKQFSNFEQPVSYIAIGRKGRDMLIRRKQMVMAEFSDLPSPPKYFDVSAIGHLALTEYMKGNYDEVYLAYTEYMNMLKQETVIRKLLPLEVEYDYAQKSYNLTHPTSAVFTYEPDREEILDAIIPRFISLQVYEAILSSQASEHAARMVAMRNATQNARKLISS
ncbi:ATP synthase F1 subunit gamma, partial [bacterium]|nr:ATP synthase F1 subunit gamma [bacterium]